ncbi:MAG: hypothetical protein ABR540_02510 [Acidimicrobiales bacterium]
MVDVSCPECGVELPSRGSIAVHLATDHAPGAPPRPASSSPSSNGQVAATSQPRSTESRQPAVVGLGVAIAVLLVSSVFGLLAKQDSSGTDGTEIPVAAGGQPAPAVAVPEGWRTVGGPGEGYTIALPPEWSDLPLSDPSVDDAMQEMLQANPQLEDVITTQVRNVLDSGGKLFAFADSGAGAVNINLIVVPSGGASLKQVSSEIPVQLADVGAKDIQVENVVLPAGRALKMSFYQSLNAPNGEAFRVEQRQYVVVQGREVFVLTLSTPDMASDGEVLDAIAHTLTVD